MSSEAKTILVIVVAIGVLSCGCICLPLGGALVLPAMMSSRPPMAKANAVPVLPPRLQRWDESQPQLSPAGLPPPGALPPAGYTTPPGFPPPVSPYGQPSGFAPPPYAPPGAALPPPTIGQPVADEAASPEPEPSTSGEPVAGLPESQRKLIYRVTRLLQKPMEQMEEQLALVREQGVDASSLAPLIDAIKKQEDDALERLCTEHKLTRKQLEAIVAEGKAQGWSDQ